jgi:hypothetical protein
MNTKTPQKQTATDSFFGMALAQAFTGFAFGVDVDMAWEACEATSAVYKERFEAKAANSDTSYSLGEKKSLGGLFEASTHNVIDLAKPITSLGYNNKVPSPSSFGFSIAA